MSRPTRRFSSPWAARHQGRRLRRREVPRRRRHAASAPGAPPPTGGTDGTVVNHVGFIVQNVQESVAKWKAAGVPVQPGNNGRLDQAYVTTPDGLSIEILEDKNQTVPIQHRARPFLRAGSRDTREPGLVCEDLRRQAGHAQQGPGRGHPGRATAVRQDRHADRPHQGPRARPHRLRREGPASLHQEARSGRHQAGPALHARPTTAARSRSSRIRGARPSSSTNGPIPVYLP